jgi:hypothetical protein
MWQRLVEDLNPIGINLATVHFDQETELAHKLGGKRGELPNIVLVMESRICLNVSLCVAFGLVCNRSIQFVSGYC